MTALFVLCLAATIRLVWGLLAPIPPFERREYDGYFGSEPSGKEYDALTRQEHDELAAWWNYCQGDESVK